MNLFDAETMAPYGGVIDAGRRNSLAALFDLVPDGVDVLDVGIGSGALGQRLTADRLCRVDGVTISAEEAQRAAPHYRRLEVADLSAVRLDSLFAGRRYGAIVCADVLEHLARPTVVLDAGRNLLADDGVLLLSVPNIAYAGLLGDLLGGEFRYRLEGLLDRTHLRFFTRRSLLRMLRETGWRVDHVEPVRLDLPESEFRVSFDRLAPALQRHLLSMPDGLTYQFIVRARPGNAAADLLQPEDSEPAPSPPHFSSLLYLGREGRFDENRKIVGQGVIGEGRQRIRFDLPASAETLSGLRLDPADRPGFLHLFALRLLTVDGEPVWQWNGDVAALAGRAHQQIVFRTPWFSPGSAMLLLTGEDPFLELPVDREQLQACARGGVLEVDMGWPMSADYSLFVDELMRHQARIAALEAQLAQAEARQAAESGAAAAARAERDAAVAEADRRRERADGLQAQAESLQARAESLQAEADRLQVELTTARGDTDGLRAQVLALQRQGSERAEEARALRDEMARLNRAMNRQRAAGDAQAQQIETLRGRLHDIESSRLFRVVSPWLRARGLPADLSGKPRAAPPAQTPDLTESVDVIVPVYRGLDETRTCLNSVLASTPRTPFRLLVVNDASPEPEIAAWLRDLAQREGRVELIENPVNAGFVASVNRAIALSGERDVVLLNSDTEVAGDWLDRLRAAAAADPQAGTVTPFSNSATICSYPRACTDNLLPPLAGTDELDRTFAAANAGRAIEIPTAVGFCMFIRRRCLAEVGLFDTERFGRGYGEENDFCMRARKAGWRHLLAADVFVHHAGGVSFGDEKAQRVQQAQDVLARLHPEYPVLVLRHLAADPAQPARLAVDVARLRASGLPSVLCVLHNTGGGTERHVRELAAALDGRANVLGLRPATGGETLLEWLQPGEGFQLGFRLPDEYESLVGLLKALAVAHVHYHHLLGHSPSVWGLPKSLGVAHDFTAHDFYAMCPQISLTDQGNRYCGEKGIEQCNGCLQRSPAPGGVSIETWRAGYRPLIEHARHVFAPSADTAARLRRHFGAANLVHVPHPDLAGPLPDPKPPVMDATRPLRVAVLGALSPIKGADVLESVAVEAARRDLPLEFHLLGFAYRSLIKPPKARLTVHGPYEEAELAELLAWLKPDVAWFPALWPETYSYTLSACLKAGLPVVAPDFGAFVERLNGRRWTWLCPWERPAAEWTEFFVRIRREHFESGAEPEPARGVEARPADFAYGRDYLGTVEMPLLPPAPTHEFLGRHRPGRGAAVTRRSKRMLLALAVRLRNEPLLRGLVRRVPLRWQTRAKVWLSR